MTDRELERRLRDALDHAAPDDVEGLLDRCGPQKGNVIPMTTTEKKKTSPRKYLSMIAAACLVLVIAGGAYGVGRYQQSNAVASVVSLDVNPSIELTLNSKEKVLSATALNSDAVAVLDGMDLVGDDLNKAMNAIIGSLLKNGYVDELANSILITVEDDDAARAAALQQKLNAEAEAILSGAKVNGAILSQTLTVSAQLREQADAYGISTGKAALIQAIVDASAGTQTFEGLVGLSINELNLLASGTVQSGSGTSGSTGTGAGTATALDSFTSTGTASQSAYIGSDAALSAALRHAGVSSSSATLLKSQFDYEDGRMVYEVEFLAGQTKYEYDIDASTGDVVTYQQETRPTQSASGTDIGSATAQSAALAHAGFSQSQVTGLRTVPDFDDGIYSYEVEFWVGSTEYDYDIDGYTGGVISFEVKTHTGYVSSGGAASTGGNGSSSSAGDIGSAEAQATALSHAGLTESQVTGLRTTRDYDDGRLEYDVEFWNGTTEYDYTIDAATGAVISSDIERHGNAGTGGNTGTSAGSTDIGAEAAKAAAFAAAGVPAGDATSVRVQREYDDGRLEYEVEFWNGTTEYDYTINGATGAVISSDTEIHQAAANTDIGTEAAKSAAFAAAGTSAANASSVRVERDYDDGRLEYDVEFWVGTTEWDITVDGSSGAILEQKREDHPNAISPDQAIGREAALTAALNHAGIAQSDIYDVEVEQELDERTPHYEVQFKSGYMEYEYRIDATTGAVLFHESEWD